MIFEGKKALVYCRVARSHVDCCLSLPSLNKELQLHNVYIAQGKCSKGARDEALSHQSQSLICDSYEYH